MFVSPKVRKNQFYLTLTIHRVLDAVDQWYENKIKLLDDPNEEKVVLHYLESTGAYGYEISEAIKITENTTIFK